MASARALAVMLARGPRMGVFGLVARAASRAAIAARWARIGIGAGRGFSAGSTLERPTSLSESVCGGVTLSLGQVDPLIVWGEAVRYRATGAPGLLSWEVDNARFLASSLAAFLVAATAAEVPEKDGLAVAEGCEVGSVKWER